MRWETVVGLEIHVELLTRSKLFCACPAAFGAPANTQCCPVCAGLPGALPVLNARALELAVKAALALNCEVAPVCRFDRKSYFYPDLPKGYQISQIDLPLGRGGAIPMRAAGAEREIRLAELHLEEDAGKLMHDAGGGPTRVDYNRCGVPLIEIVTLPDLRSGEAAASCLEALREILIRLGVSDCKMQEGSLRCDVNVSLRPAGSGTFGTRAELKNLGSLRAVRRAVAFETARQAALLDAGRPVLQETLRWDEEREETVPLRAKEDARGYRCFPEPDLPPVPVPAVLLARLREQQPELPGRMRARYEEQFGLGEYDAALLARDGALAAFFEAAVSLGAPPKQAANWILSRVLALLAAHGQEAGGMVLSPRTLAGIIALTDEGTLSRSAAVRVLEAVFLTDGDPDAYGRREGLFQAADAARLNAAARRAVEENPKAAADYRAGKEKALGFLVGQVLRELGGRCAPDTAAAALRERLKE